MGVFLVSHFAELKRSDEPRTGGGEGGRGALSPLGGCTAPPAEGPFPLKPKRGIFAQQNTTNFTPIKGKLERVKAPDQLGIAALFEGIGSNEAGWVTDHELIGFLLADGPLNQEPTWPLRKP